MARLFVHSEGEYACSCDCLRFRASGVFQVRRKAMLAVGALRTVDTWLLCSQRVVKVAATLALAQPIKPGGKARLTVSRQSRFRLACRELYELPLEERVSVGLSLVEQLESLEYRKALVMWALPFCQITFCQISIPVSSAAWAESSPFALFAKNR